MAHIAKGTVYQYFATKEDIFISLLKSYVIEWEKAIALNVEDFLGPGNPGDYAVAYLRHRIRKSLHFFAANPDRCNIILRMGIGLNSSIESAITIFEDKVMAVICHDFNLARKFHHIPEDADIVLISNAVLGAFLRLGYFYFFIKKDSTDRPSLEDLENRIVGMTAHAMGISGYEI